VHLHGAHTPPENDGYPQAWFLPAAHNIQSGYAKKGSFYDMFRNASPLGSQWTPDSSVYFYPNDQRATALWFHDHSLGLTRVNNYAGALGFYLLRGGPDDVVPGELPGPAPRRGDRPNQDYFEIPLVLHDRLFNTDGSLFFPDSRTFFDGFAGPYIPTSDIAPIFNPEVFGNTIVVNGQTFRTDSRGQVRIPVTAGSVQLTVAVGMVAVGFCLAAAVIEGIPRQSLAFAPFNSLNVKVFQ
jgi:hypothetical protein